MKASEYVKRGWCQGVSARDDRDRPVGPRGSAAVAWCITGAIYASLETSTFDAHYWGSTDAVLESLGVSRVVGLATWNDRPERTQAMVVEALEAVGQ